LFKAGETRKAVLSFRAEVPFAASAGVDEMRETSKRRLWKSAGRKMMVRWDSGAGSWRGLQLSRKHLIGLGEPA
jgi:hypothetical protein